LQRTATLKLTGRTHLLDEPMRNFTAACNTLARHVEAGECRPNAILLQKAYHHEVRTVHGLMSQVAISATRVVQGTYRALRTSGHDAHPDFTSPRLVLLHRREWRFKNDKLVLSLPGGQASFDVQASSTHVGMLLYGEAGAGTLIKRGVNYYLKVAVELPNEPTYEPAAWYGVDGGIRNTATLAATGERPILFNGGAIREYRKRQRRTRRRLQKKGTRSARRVQTRLSGREKRHVLNQCRIIAKTIVTRAAAERRGIKLEDLTNANQRARVRRAQRAERHSWAFRVLQQCIVQKAEEHGVPVLFVEPAHTSRTCPKCGDARKSNRNGDSFQCEHCGYANHADVVGATNISRRPGIEQNLAPGGGPVNGPHGHSKTDRRSHRAAVTPEKASKPPTSVGGS
jgi:IS605 OrfB family transposase